MRELTEVSFLAKGAGDTVVWRMKAIRHAHYVRTRIFKDKFARGSWARLGKRTAS
jgi:hypothetical protein